MATKYSICDGTFIGHAIASQFDASLGLAYHAAESLLEKDNFDGPDILSRYLNYFDREKSEVGGIIKLLHTESRAYQPVDASNRFLFHQRYIADMVRTVDQKVNGQTTGCSPAQRSFPLALFPKIQTDDLFRIVLEEAKLTHQNPIAGQVAGIVNLIIRYLLEANDWNSAIQKAFQQPNLHADVSSIQVKYFRFSKVNANSDHSYSPNALAAALYHVSCSKTAGEAITEAQKQEKAYCTPITGIIAGARWGISMELYSDFVNDTQMKKIRVVASRLSELWNSEKGVTA